MSALPVLPNVLIVSTDRVSDRTVVLIKIMAMDKGFELYEEIVQDGLDTSQLTLLEIPYQQLTYGIH